MPGVSAALGDKRHLHSGRVIEVSGLVGSSNLKLFHAVDRRRHHAGGLAAVQPHASACYWIVLVREQAAGGIITNPPPISCT